MYNKDTDTDTKYYLRNVKLCVGDIRRNIILTAVTDHQLLLSLFSPVQHKNTMFVTEPDGALSEKTHVRIRITNMQGSCVVLNVPLDYSIDKLKVEIANYLGKETNVESDPLKISLYHKLILAESGKILNEESTLVEEGVHDEGKFCTSLVVIFRVWPKPPKKY